MKTAVVTGGAGFIGSNLCEYLVKKGFYVICIDNLSTGSLDNLKDLWDRNFKFIRQDICESINLPGSINYVLDLASPASPVDYLKYPVETLKVGSVGMYNIIELAKRKKARFLLASTSEVYGDPLVHPQRENYFGNVNPVGPRSCYNEAKRFAEAITMAYHRTHKVRTAIVRIFNTYGEKMRLNDGRVVPNFIYQALGNKDITIYGDGKQTRSFCYVSDLIEGIYKLLISDFNEPVNLGNPNEKTILEFAKIIVKLTGSKSKIVFKPLPSDDPKQRKPDIRRAKKLLNWQPRVSLEDGLYKTIKWFKENT